MKADEKIEKLASFPLRLLFNNDLITKQETQSDFKIQKKNTNGCSHFPENEFANIFIKPIESAYLNVFVW